MSHTKNWILLADGGKARIMERVAPLGKLTEIFTLSHTHEPTHEHGHDRPGRTFESSSPTRHAYEAPSDWHELQKKDFARKLADLLKDAYKAKKFKELLLICPPHMLGLLRACLNNSPVCLTVTKESDKDMLSLSLQEIQDYVDNLPTKETGR